MNYILKSLIFISFSLLLFVCPANAAHFIDGLEDVPIPANMQQISTDNISFGNEESRLVEAYLTSSKIGFKAVEKFYIDTLPQLGWIFQNKAENRISFYRDGENLEIVREKLNPLVVRITLKSQN